MHGVAAYDNYWAIAHALQLPRAEDQEGRLSDTEDATVAIVSCCFVVVISFDHRTLKKACYT